jgi:hypothetical protein
VCPNEPRTDDETLGLGEAYLAMYHFVDAYWERGGRRDGSITLLRHAMGPSGMASEDGPVDTADPAFWNDWIKAIEKARNEGMPQEL